ncbi:hypothetical protein UB43_03370 [Pseudomonas sp. 21]|uniref:hypothetical protein n=1 Tax=Pseudomonas sp. 21 TaxID=1619948 RepID=UPI0005EB4E85|nr:hypothetical protein [Pseudomonas sp. 21]KJK03552.1 hypothetical protein UB43_03370 [Pseudomonas sp. 21]
MDLRKEIQRNPVADEVQALIAVVIPILQGVLFAIKQEAIQDAGGLPNIRLRQLPRLYRPGDGDCGICFEYAIHDAISNGNQLILDRIDSALSQHCRIRGGDPDSILFGAEKTGAVQLIQTARDMLTDESSLLSGSKGRPVKLKKHIDSVASAFRKRADREALPASINGLWKADLFVGRTGPDQWVGTTVKINPRQLEGARGLRLAIVPSQQGRNDAIRIDDQKNLIVAPVPYDASFMEVFYQGWQIVQQFIHADAQVPREVALPRPPDRQVCRFLEERREFPILDVIEGLRPLAQPHLLETQEEALEVNLRKGDASDTGLIVAPVPARDI